MPDKTLTVATYAAGASFAAITLIYVFGPTFFFDSGPSASTNRNRGVVGLSNPANDCFINSVLQALAGLGDLRLYLIRETHRRILDDELVYAQVVPVGMLPGDGHHFRSDTPDWKMEGFQKGLVTKGLKDILDSLNERPLHKKTISAMPFLRVLEDAFRQRISRQQQDAQEFLQVVAERLCNEYHAGQRARVSTRRMGALAEDSSKQEETSPDNGPEQTVVIQVNGIEKPQGQIRDVGSGLDEDEDEDEEGFPMEGRSESQIECLTCGFKPRPTATTFCTLTLNVPRVSSATTLGACFDGMFKTEYIDDFKCEKCRLAHAISLLEANLQRSPTEAAKENMQEAIDKLKIALATDPENPPKDVALPDPSHAPRRRIARHIRLTSFPKILAIHLSRSIFDAHYSQKNSAKVAFPEELPLGGLLHQKKYRLLGVVTHKGSHDSGHYETFRRQVIQPPFSNPNTFKPADVYSRTASPMPTPHLTAQRPDGGEESPLVSTPDLLSPSGGESPTPPLEPLTISTPENQTPALPDEDKPRPSLSSPPKADMPVSRARDSDSISLQSVAANAKSTFSKIAPKSPSVAGSSSKSLMEISSKSTISAKPKRRKVQDRWWRISDDKVKEATTRDVLSMQREVYLLFYEIERI
ncbi:putative ubiquitin carboxyl-terminal hydrolase 16 [Triangularia verruculosa]|uniref:Ubiquitin carboxyl-terminal hydrolase n=1 Tax=Triangularia verruculosa TaxID=2587418 RepID=A0AAN7ASI2_9PEZI|nr:putative ubiquitin carboxyl-terminal hydrolase 16 [Triangularia verruculosa]